MRGLRTLCAVVIVGIGMAVGPLAAGGATTPPQQRGPVVVCNDLAHLIGATITRKTTLHDALRFRIPARATLRSYADVVALAAVLCALPRTPTGPVFCPADLGVRYTVAFSATDRAIDPVVISPAGCETVTGLGGIREASTSLWQVLGLAFGARNATAVTFSGGLVP